ncbi:MAG: hypothetical protein B6U88_01450 [Candidatus Aenigmarchaeota archaeon ex4484_56]|nr:MAG: hypothetical protein B6U88_01450 [Candidatus Aenigmarchaeota archaeon ex4484_56]
MKESIGILIGLLLLSIVIYFSGGMEVLNLIFSVNFIYLVIAILCEFIIIILFTIRLKSILYNQKYKLPVKEIFKILLAGSAVNQLTPVLKIGGEPLKVYYLSKKEVPTSKASASIIVEIVSELASLYIFLLLLVLFLSFYKYLPLDYLYIEVFITLLFIVSVVVSFKFMLSEKRVENFIRKYLLKVFKGRGNDVKVSSKLFSYTILNLFKDKKLCFCIFSLSFLARIFEILRLYFIFLAINFNLNLFLILVFWVLQILFSMIPWLPGGLGLVEGGTISTLALLGISTKYSSSIVLLDRFIGLWIPVLTGLISVKFIKISRKH